MNINEELKKLNHGGKVSLPAGQTDISEPVILDTPCIKIEGDIWCCNADPNGVFECEYGTKLKLAKNDIPAIYVGKENVLCGIVIKDIGIQGNIKGMDTRGMFDFENPCASSGICFDSKRVDQGEVSKVSCCGLGSGICVTGTAEIDGCTFEKINVDGCCIGFYFAPGASFYPIFKNCIAADNPWYGFFVNGEGIEMHNLDINDFRFVRNGGAFPDEFPYPKAAVCFYKVSDCSVRNNIFDLAGTFWYYDDDATENCQRQPSVQPTPALWIEGNRNRITGNTFLTSSDKSVVVKGDCNILMNNIVDNDILIDGNGNIVSNIVFTSGDAKIIVSKDSCGTEFINIPKERIVYQF